ncbi:MAG TPA: hypothetical protein VMR96_11290 [Solirubrobacterales bacterium]|nr:hypothetical protein [Solirubrobacterales bacterium]
MAWLMVLGLVALLSLQFLRGRRGSALRGDVSRKARRLGNDLVAFSRRRLASVPRDEGAAWRQLLGGSKPRREYEADTMSLFRERFSEGLLQLIDDLRNAGLIGLAEARSLSTPANPDAIERIGRRLIELGTQATPS